MEKSKFRQEPLLSGQDLKMASETGDQRCDRLDMKELEIAVTFKKTI